MYTPKTTGVARYSSLRGEPSIISRTTSAARTDHANAASDFGVPSLNGHAGTTRRRTWMARATLTPSSETVHATAAPRMPWLGMRIRFNETLRIRMTTLSIRASLLRPAWLSIVPQGPVATSLSLPRARMTVTAAPAP